jgi:hypothetical protein
MPTFQTITTRKAVNQDEYSPATATGMPNVTALDYFREIVNDTQRRVVIDAFNDNESGDYLPLMARCLLPDFETGFAYGDDCTQYDSGQWTLTQATTGTAALAVANYGVIELDSASSTADQGVQVQHLVSIPAIAANHAVRFGCRIKVTDTVDKAQVFAGLAITDTTIFASGVPGVTDYVGFMLDAGDAAAKAVALELNSTSGSEEKSAAVHTLVEDTYVVLEFEFDGVSTVTPYVDGVAGTAITVSDPPEGALRPSFACLSEGTNDPILSLDWWYVQTTNR